tara:strand:- start:271 stop:729 length:459 start_codon:yes stop_codon:yes gene_type:complete
MKVIIFFLGLVITMACTGNPKIEVLKNIPQEDLPEKLPEAAIDVYEDKDANACALRRIVELTKKRYIKNGEYPSNKDWNIYINSELSTSSESDCLTYIKIVDGIPVDLYGDVIVYEYKTYQSVNLYSLNHKDPETGAPIIYSFDRGDVTVTN